MEIESLVFKQLLLKCTKLKISCYTVENVVSIIAPHQSDCKLLHSLIYVPHGVSMKYTNGIYHMRGTFGGH